MIDPARVGRILSRLHDLGEIRRTPAPDDIPGEFDAWFDGGAYRVITGSTTYVFADSTRAVVAVSPRLSISIKFADGVEVQIQERGALEPLPPQDRQTASAPPVFCAGCGKEIAAGSTHKFVGGMPFHMGC